MFWRRTRHAAAQVDFSGHFEGSAFAVGDHAVANTYHGTVIQQFAADTAPRPKRRPPPQDRSPRDPVELLGRAAELGRIEEALSSGSATAVHGSAGVGKTALLKHVARQRGGRWPDGVLYANVGGQPLDDVLQWLFTVFWDTGEVVYVPGPLRVGEFLAHVRALVVLDDIDRDHAEVERLVDGAPSCGFALGAAEPVLPGRSHPLGGLDAAAARDLFARFLGRALTDAERPAVDAFAAHVEGLAGYVVTGAEMVRDGICGPDDLLAQAGALLAQRRLAALPASQRQLLALLAELAPAPVPADRLGPGAAEELEHLRAAGFVERHSPRYTLAAALDVEQDREAAYTSAADLLRRLASEPGRVDADDAPSVAAALRWGRRAGQAEMVVEAARALSPAMLETARPGAWGVVLAEGLAAARVLDRPADEARFLHDQGTLLGCLGERAEAREALTRALEIRREHDAAGVPVTWHNLGELFGGPGPSRGDDEGSGDDGGSRPPRALVAGAGSLVLLGVVAIVALGGGGPPHEDGGETASEAAATATASATTTVTAGPDQTSPRITLIRPRRGARVIAGTRVLAAYRCRDRGRPARVCKGTVSSGGAIDTTEGDHRFVVHARDDAGNTADLAVTYRAERGPPPGPAITIAQPKDGASYPFGSRLLAQYRCRNASGCVGDVEVGRPVNSRPGTHEFTVRATGTDGRELDRTVTYSVEARPPDPLVVSATTSEAEGRLTVVYACSGGTAPVACKATLDGSEIDSGAFLGCGEHTAVVTARDAEGATKQQSFPIDGGNCPG
jgi:hypothetical protein